MVCVDDNNCYLKGKELGSVGWEPLNYWKRVNAVCEAALITFLNICRRCENPSGYLLQWGENTHHEELCKNCLLKYFKERGHTKIGGFIKIGVKRKPYSVKEAIDSHENHIKHIRNWKLRS